jgi:hypothetical protein
LSAVGLFVGRAHVHLCQPLTADPAPEPAGHGAVGQGLVVILGLSGGPCFTAARARSPVGANR